MCRELVKTQNMFPSLYVWDDKPECCFNAASGSERPVGSHRFGEEAQPMRRVVSQGYLIDNSYVIYLSCGSQYLEGLWGWASDRKAKQTTHTQESSLSPCGRQRWALFLCGPHSTWPLGDHGLESGAQTLPAVKNKGKSIYCLGCRVL